MACMGATAINMPSLRGEVVGHHAPASSMGSSTVQQALHVLGHTSVLTFWPPRTVAPVPSHFPWSRQLPQHVGHTAWLLTELKSVQAPLSMHVTKL